MTGQAGKTGAADISIPGTEAFQAMATESLDLWLAGSRAWAAYLSRMAQVTEPQGWIDATTALMGDQMELCQRAAAIHLRNAGVKAPLLNDA